ncbi:helix-turn-helix transcriptional regulator [Candidatus Woesearchaeota archaeon]|nr:helix-turn-helix transcriptional regulator [Candidatus Woesearchaeota archaeon]
MKKTRVPKKEQLLLEETAMQRILRVLFWYPELEFSLSELAKEASVSKSTASRLIDNLKEVLLVNVVDKGVVLRITANRESPEFFKRKIAYNLSVIYSTNLIEYLEQTLDHPKAIILIGSFRYGQDISTSDIDIVAEVAGDFGMVEYNIKELESYKPYFGGREIRVQLFNREKVDSAIFNSIANGIVLSGFLEVKPWKKGKLKTSL